MFFRQMAMFNYGNVTLVMLATLVQHRSGIDRYPPVLGGRFVRPDRTGIHRRSRPGEGRRKGAFLESPSQAWSPIAHFDDAPVPGLRRWHGR